MVEEQSPVVEQPHKRPPNFCMHCNDEKPWDDPRAFGIHLERHREVLDPVKDPKTGKINSTPCPNNCGRHFFRPSHYREHVPLCDGQTPLWSKPQPPVAKPAPATAAPVALPLRPPAPAAPVAPSVPRESSNTLEDIPMPNKTAKVHCPDCGAGPWMDKRGVAAHKRGPNCGTGATPPKTKKETASRKSSDTTAASSNEIVEQLRNKAKEARDQAETVVLEAKEKAEGLEKKAVELDEMADKLEKLL